MISSKRHNDDDEQQQLLAATTASDEPPTTTTNKRWRNFVCRGGGGCLLFSKASFALLLGGGLIATSTILVVRSLRRKIFHPPRAGGGNSSSSSSSSLTRPAGWRIIDGGCTLDLNSSVMDDAKWRQLVQEAESSASVDAIRALRHLEPVINIFSNIRKIDMHNYNAEEVTVSSVRALERLARIGVLANLKELHLRENTLTEGAAQEIAETAQRGGFRGIRKLLLYNNNFGVQGVKNIAHAIQNGAFVNLEELHFYDNSLDGDGLKALYEAVSCVDAFQNLKLLHLRGDGMANDSLKLLADAMANGALAQLERLHLCLVGVDVNGVQALISAAENHGSLANLAILDIAYNCNAEAATVLGHAGVRGTFPRLHSLYLNCNGIPPRTWVELKQQALQNDIDVM
eukprot:CAMPEP_0206122084 /NCGR_PEP_ID=MMETSP1472-20131121/1881_1 /ASSEMBLY_ACC=CAM_ASM_001108 /TAXON_ID=41880 /ORGANISM="Pycnococcus provasolii, Strain RCC251" /LENGTH=400 /DNA_ID=CAMNT_0053512527 /DNA_START=76 /DNA_END=1278 /DNA_ORIENTATION=-